MSSAKRVHKYWSNKNLNKHVRKLHEEAKGKKRSNSKWTVMWKGSSKKLYFSVIYSIIVAFHKQCSTVGMPQWPGFPHIACCIFNGATNQYQDIECSTAMHFSVDIGCLLLSDIKMHRWITSWARFFTRNGHYKGECIWESERINFWNWLGLRTNGLIDSKLSVWMAGAMLSSGLWRQSWHRVQYCIHHSDTMETNHPGKMTS